MTSVYKTREENAMALKGQRIQYRKQGSRNGWTGSIIRVDRDSTMPGGFAVIIEYDNGVVQQYCIEAIEGFGISLRFENAAGYLALIEPHTGEPAIDHSVPLYIVTSSVGHYIASGNDYEYLCRKAESAAERSKIGVKYYVCRAMTMFEKQPHPVIKTELNL